MLDRVGVGDPRAYDLVRLGRRDDGGDDVGQPVRAADQLVPVEVRLVGFRDPAEEPADPAVRERADPRPAASTPHLYVNALGEPGVIELGNPLDHIGRGDLELGCVVEAVADDRVDAVARDDQVTARGRTVGELGGRGTAVLPYGHDLGTEAVDPAAKHVDDL